MHIESIHNQHGEQLEHSFHPGAADSDHLLVLGHGVTANKDRPFLVALAEAVSARGLACLRFSFSGNGGSQGEFVDSTVSKEVEDLRAALAAVPDQRISYAGHSMGAAVGVLAAAQEPRIERLISLAGMVHTAEFARRKFGELVPGRDCMWDKPECPLSSAYMQDMAAIDSVVELGPRVARPWLLVHGDADSVVPLSDAQDILARADAQAELVVLPGADHVFAGAATEAMVAAVLGWLG